MVDSNRLRNGSRVIHGGQHVEPVTGALVPPIFTSSTFGQSSPGAHKGFEYSRSHNPSRYALERMVADLERSGLSEDQDPSCGGFAFASGMATMGTLLELADAGSRILSMDDLYGGSRRLLTRVRERSQGFDLAYVDMSSTSAFEQAMTPETRMVWVETPTNPLLKIVDLPAVAEIARGIRPDVILVCDNTFASPIYQRPLELGFDVVMHSTTKYLNGHSDSVGGVAVVKTPEMADQLRFLQNSIGAIMSPFEAYLTLRGIKTLDIRMRRHSANAQRVAEFLESHEKVDRVLFPSLDSHPQNALYERQMEGPGGMLTFDVRGGLSGATQFLEALRIFQIAESLGAVESLVNHPAIMTHASVPADVREELGISDAMIRLSIGIEDGDDLLEDVEQALGAVA